VRKFAGILAGLTLLAATSASAAVSTTCGNPDTCTLDQLFGGDSITVDDVTFDSFALTDSLGLAVAPANVSVTGGGSATEAWIDFAFDPSLSIQGDSDFYGFLFSLIASLDPLSSRNIIGASLSFNDGAFSISGDATAEAAAALGTGDFLDIYSDSLLGDEPLSAATFAAIASLAADLQINVLGYEPGALATVSGFRFLVTLDEESPVIPLPAAAPIFLAGLGALGALRRRKSR